MLNIEYYYDPDYFPNGTYHNTSLPNNWTSRWHLSRLWAWLVAQWDFWLDSQFSVESRSSFSSSSLSSCLLRREKLHSMWIKEWIRILVCNKLDALFSWLSHPRGLLHHLFTHEVNFSVRWGEKNGTQWGSKNGLEFWFKYIRGHKLPRSLCALFVDLTLQIQN